MHRPTIGLIAVVLLAVPLLGRGYLDEALTAGCFRVGVLVAALWFAQPQLRGMPRWLMVVTGVGAFVVLRWPRLLVFALPLAAVLWFLRPRALGQTARRE